MFLSRNSTVTLLCMAFLCAALAGCESSTDDETVESPMLHLSSPGHLDGIAPPDSPWQLFPRSVPGPAPQDPADTEDTIIYYLA